MKKRLLILLIGLFILGIITVSIIKSMEPKDHYIVSYRPMNVNSRVKRGYKVIGRYKLRNPTPRPITYEDAEFIKAKLPEWLKMHYPKYDSYKQFNMLTPPALIDKLKYKFTVLYCGEMHEGDIYLLQLGNREEPVNVYIGKARVIDDIKTFTTKDTLIYPFYDEEWHSNRDDETLYKPGDLW